MPTELNRIKELAGLQEASATESLPAPSSDEEHAEMLFKTHPEYSKKYKTVQNFMRSQDFRDHMDHLSYKAQEASAAQPVNSSVDDTIQRARAQIETLEAALKEDYKKFQGMKPYKPKKK